MNKNVLFGMLNDYYGGLLTDRQREIMHMYYDCDMSLAEISEETNVTRQAVRENLVRGAKKLNELEQKLGLVGKVRGIADSIDDILVDLDGKDAATIRLELCALKEKIKEL